MGRVLRRALGGLLVAVLLVTALAFYTYSPYLNVTAAPGGLSTTAPSPGAPTGRSAAPPGSATPAPSTTAVPPDQPPPPDPGGRAGRIELVATVRSGQVFEITETVRVAAPVSRVTLAPADLSRTSSRLRSALPYATDVVIRVADQPAVRPGGRLARARTVALHRPTDRFEVRYRLHGSIRFNEPSSAGRALGAVAPLTRRLPADTPVAVTVRGSAVLNLGCVDLPPAEQACIEGERPTARVNQDLPYRAALVQVQLNLGGPR